MPLSEHEQRMLDQIERALYEDDPKFANSVDERRIRRRRPVIAGIAFLIGLVCLVSGVILAQDNLGLGVTASVVGFVLMVVGVGLLVFGQPAGRATMAGSTAAPAKKPASNLSDRMEERFRRRFEQD
jgi:VIT1/CCC1 family predicted Fe2+/Mn2+ transporter